MDFRELDALDLNGRISGGSIFKTSTRSELIAMTNLAAMEFQKFTPNPTLNLENFQTMVDSYKNNGFIATPESYNRMMQIEGAINQQELAQRQADSLFDTLQSDNVLLTAYGVPGVGQVLGVANQFGIVDAPEQIITEQLLEHMPKSALEGLGLGGDVLMTAIGDGDLGRRWHLPTLAGVGKGLGFYGAYNNFKNLGVDAYRNGLNVNTLRYGVLGTMDLVSIGAKAPVIKYGNIVLKAGDCYVENQGYYDLLNKKIFEE